MRPFLAGLAFWLCGAALAAPATPLPAPVARALAAARIPESAVAVVVHRLDAPASAARLAHNAQTPFNPASVMKLVTTYGALEILGPAATWETGAWALGPPDADGRLRGDLYLQGSGDPKFTLEQFTALLRQLRVRGVRQIDGDLRLDRSAFVLPPFDPGAFDGKALRAYNVGPDALLVDFHALRFSLKPEAGGVRLWPETPSAGLVVDAHLVPAAGPCEGWRDRLDIRLSPGRLEIAGPYPLACGEKTLYLAPLSADAHIEGLFRALWQELGGRFNGRVRDGVTPPEAICLARQSSPPLAEILRDINKWSNNVMARQLFLALGAAPLAGGNGENAAGAGKGEKTPSGQKAGNVERGKRMARFSEAPDGEDSAARARARLRRGLADLGLDFPELVLENGAGLSRQERISAASLDRLLLAAWQSPFMPEFVASLPIAGIDGTLEKRLTDADLVGRAHLKTGTLDGVKAAAGYVFDRQGRRYALTFLINHPQAAAGQAAIDALVAGLIRGDIE